MHNMIMVLSWASLSKFEISQLGVVKLNSSFHSIRNYIECTWYA